MPASSINLYHMQDAKNNFQALRPAPVCSDSNMFMGQCQNIHVSTNCYYGFHDQKNISNISEDVDCEMIEVSHGEDTKATSSEPQSNARKRSAEDYSYPKNKRLREEGMVPTPPNYNPCLLRPTHNNPDISRCLMVHMI
ncbi:unnamed protein product, partial [Brenthis ino]